MIIYNPDIHNAINEIIISYETFLVSLSIYILYAYIKHNIMCNIHFLLNHIIIRCYFSVSVEVNVLTTDTTSNEREIRR